MKNGKGVYSWPNGKVYNGEWKDDKYHGNALVTNTKGMTKEYQFENGVRIKGAVDSPVQDPLFDATKDDKQIENSLIVD